MSDKKERRQLPRTVARRAAQYASDKQALDVIVLDLRKVTDFADYFVICSGVVDVHVKAIYQHIEAELLKYGWKPKDVEGEDNLRWVLMDYIDIVVHVFQPDSRGYYAVEKLWGDAPQVIVKGVTKK